MTGQRTHSADKSEPKTQGEGDKESARRFNEEEAAFVRGGKVAPAAKSAREAQERPEGDELAKAEAKGKARGKN